MDPGARFRRLITATGLLAVLGVAAFFYFEKASSENVTGEFARAVRRASGERLPAQKRRIPVPGKAVKVFTQSELVDLLSRDRLCELLDGHESNVSDEVAALLQLNDVQVSVSDDSPGTFGQAVLRELMPEENSARFFAAMKGAGLMFGVADLGMETSRALSVLQEYAASNSDNAAYHVFHALAESRHGPSFNPNAVLRGDSYHFDTVYGPLAFRILLQGTKNPTTLFLALSAIQKVGEPDFDGVVALVKQALQSSPSEETRQAARRLAENLVREGKAAHQITRGIVGEKELLAGAEIYRLSLERPEDRDEDDLASYVENLLKEFRPSTQIIQDFQRAVAELDQDCNRQKVDRLHTQFLDELEGR